MYIKTNYCALLTNDDSNNRWLPGLGGRRKQGQDGKRIKTFGYKMNKV